ncbi:MAG TPA: hypothetical protein HPP81_01390 [Deltaproteobacteria bacterium]|jgi:hypothetical protein|nr:hypothetical protein [Deltaproteobacteria bacterium]
MNTLLQAIRSHCLSCCADQPRVGLPIAQTIGGLAATHPRSFGGEAAAKLLTSSFYQLSHDLETTRQELQRTQLDRKQACDKLSDLKTEVAVLREHVRGHPRENIIRNLCSTVGTGLIGIGVTLHDKNVEGIGYLTGLLGIGLLAFAWLYLYQRTAK